jgi:hypothetical protein
VQRFRFWGILFVGVLASAAPAFAAFVFRVGDTVYVDGKAYSWDEWKKIRDNPDLRTPQQTPAAAVNAAVGAGGTSSAAPGPRAATCTTPIYYDEFPKDDDEFVCTAGLGSLTREQILRMGWKIDFIEKLPPLPGQPVSSPRGRPLSLYKLVISRYADGKK